MLHTIHLVRHGEVENPDHVVYADLPGFGLSATGSAQAEAAANHLHDKRVQAVLSSPLQRAVETATPIGAATGCALAIDDRLTEWGLSGRWGGVPWDDLPERFPGELERYLGDPAGVDFASETIATVADRMAAVLDDIDIDVDVAVLVSHQDPLQALRLRLTRRSPAQLNENKPVHAGVITLDRAGRDWVESNAWSPTIGSPPFPPVDGP